MANFQAVAASLPVRGETCDLADAEGLSTRPETDTEIAPRIPKIGATSIAGIDRLMAELQEAKDYLQSEGERIEQETVRYTNLTQMASVTAKIISDAVAQWHPVRNRRKSSASEVTGDSTEDLIGASGKSSQHGQQKTSQLG
jgi:putative protein kinase ArgK-like GTPase of G3E family